MFQLTFKQTVTNTAKAAQDNGDRIAHLLVWELGCSRQRKEKQTEGEKCLISVVGYAFCNPNNSRSNACNSNEIIADTNLSECSVY